MPAPVLIPFDDARRIWEAVSLAGESLRRFKFHKGHYNNSMDSHLVGRFGELAVERWAVELGIHVDSPFRDYARNKDCDVVVTESIARLEVKTWSAQHWKDLGRCVSVDQVDRIEERADVVVWAVLVEQKGVPAVELHGWSTIDDVKATRSRMTGLGNYLKENHQVDEVALRDLAQIVAGGGR